MINIGENSDNVYYGFSVLSSLISNSCWMCKLFKKSIIHFTDVNITNVNFF